MSDISDVLQEAIELVGTQAKLGKAAGCSQNAIHHAKKKGRVTADMAVGIERATNGEIPRWRLRPDLWPVPVPTPQGRDAAA